MSQTLQNLSHPLSVAIALLAIGVLLWRNSVWARGLCATALFLILIFASPLTSDALLRSLEEQYPDSPVETLPSAQAIVVLGGSVQIPSGRHRDSELVDASDRELRAARLYKAGKAPLVLAAGGTHPIAGGTRTPESYVIRDLLQEWGVPAQAILVEDRSLNTRENALFSFQILKARHVQRILLVTSATHMPRAAATFRKAGFDVVPASAEFHTGWRSFGLQADWWPTARALDRSDLAIKEWLGLLVYRLRGWA